MVSIYNNMNQRVRNKLSIEFKCIPKFFIVLKRVLETKRKSLEELEIEWYMYFRLAIKHFFNYNYIYSKDLEQRFKAF